MNPYVFVVGCPRSGTTLLQRLLDAHPRLAVIDETRWIDHWHTQRKGVNADGLVTGKLITRLLEFPRFAQLGLGREELESLLDGGRPLEYPSFVSRLFDLYGRAQGKPLVGDKTPRYVRSIPTLHELFPPARFVHLIRDGRATSLSVVNWRKAQKLASTFPSWRDHPLPTAALWWEWQVRLGREAGVSLGPRLYREVSYEALVDHAASELEPLCGFLDLTFDKAMLRFHEGRRRSESGLSPKSAWLPPTPGLRDWRTQMPAEEVERFEAVAGELLGELGYPRAVPKPPSAARALAAELRGDFVRELQSRGRRLPEAWQRARRTIGLYP
jgi:Sulfotransferase family